MPRYKLFAFQLIKIISFIILTEATCKIILKYYYASPLSDYYLNYIYAPLKGKVQEQFLGNGDQRILKFIIVVLLYLFWLKLTNKEVKNALSLRINLLSYLKGLGLGLLSLLLIMFVYYLIGHITFTLPNSLLTFVINFVLVWALSTFTSIKEELVFRGYCLSVFNKITNVHVANAIQAVLFGTLHLLNKNASLALFLTTTLAGFVLGYLKLRFNSLASAVGFHTAIHLSSTFNSFRIVVNGAWISMGNNLFGVIGQLYFMLLLVGLALTTRSSSDRNMPRKA